MNRAANTITKALRQLDLSIESAEEAEVEVRAEQLDLGAAMRDLRVVAMVPRNAIAQQLRVDSMQIIGLEHRACSDQGKKYRDAVQYLLRAGYGR